MGLAGHGRRGHGVGGGVLACDGARQLQSVREAGLLVHLPLWVQSMAIMTVGVAILRRLLR